MAILWLASYPKSGNTWLRAFLANYVAGLPQSVPINELYKFSFSDAHSWPYENLLKKPLSELSEAEIIRARPKVHEMLAKTKPSHVMVKTHNLLTAIEGIPTITPSVTFGAIYVIRNPLDTTVSTSHHYGEEIEDSVRVLGFSNATIQPNATNVRQYLGSWSDHVRSWTTADGLYHLVLRYEDMLSKPHREFARVIKFMGLPEDRARLDRAIKFSSFRELSGQEKKIGFIERSKNAERFFRKGKAGTWRTTLDQDHIARIIADHGDVMVEHGYLSADRRKVLV